MSSTRKRWEREPLDEDIYDRRRKQHHRSRPRKAAKETGLAVFASEEQFAELIGTDNTRVVEIWNSLAGVKPVAKFANQTVGSQRIWRAIQNLGESNPTDASSEPAVEARTEHAR